MNPISTIRSTSVVLPVTNVDTDQIIPARFLTTTTREGLGKHAFADWRYTADGALKPDFALNKPEASGCRILVAGRNFGCGSSREHAPQAIYRYGIRGIVGESFSEIFFGNSVALGLPCVRVDREHALALMDAVERDPSIQVRIDLDAETAGAGALTFTASMPEAAREALRSGAWDAAGLLRERPEAVRMVAARLPYVRAFDA